jgi:hypothetical protein
MKMPMSNYKTIAEASAAAIRLNITTIREYKQRYKEDPQLPEKPHTKYADEWEKFGKWLIFLGKGNRRKKFYSTIGEASAATIRLGITTNTEYKQRNQEDQRLSANPDRTYADEWEGFGKWFGFFGKEDPRKNFYPTIKEASAVAIRLKITFSTEYAQRYREDPRLPACPDKVYSDEWTEFGKWFGFLGNVDRSKNFYPTIEEASAAAIRFGITTHKEYTQHFQDDPRLPSTPDEIYADEWVEHGRWFGFLGNKVPVAPEQISDEYKSWLALYDLYMKDIQRNISHHKRVILEFIVHFLQKYSYPSEPALFLSKKAPINFDQYESFLIKEFGDKAKGKFHTSALNFVDFCLKELCTDEDDDGLIIHPDYLNPLSKFQSPLLEIKENRLDESNKPVLAYKYIVKAREWITPTSAKSFRDLQHLHDVCETDWFDVDSSLIDEDDKDCVYRVVTLDQRHKGKSHKQEAYQMWSPVRFLALFTLLNVPARGQQVLWCDSGEADKSIPVMVNGKVKWQANDSSLAGKTKLQGFIKAYPDDELGLHFTTNKTSAKEGGYDVPWIPDGLVEWMIRLRRWQSKYNPLPAPIRWTDIDLVRPVGERILQQRGSNCFLFRQPNSYNPYKTAIFSKILAFVLHQIEKSDNRLTSTISQTGSLASYRSPYTAHSLRVSLITAFVIDAKIPVHIVQKLVGHARLVMTLYYTKIGHAEMRDQLNAAGKRALAASPDRIAQQMRNKKLEELKPGLVGNNSEFLDSLTNDYPRSAFTFSDIGICPMSGGRCEEGGELIAEQGKQRIYGSVAAGHLGARNCFRCRFFITGPAFLGGLITKGNEVSLKAHDAAKKYHQHQIEIQVLEDEQYDCESRDVVFTRADELAKAETNSEIIAKEVDMYACDFISISRLIKPCIALLNEPNKAEATDQGLLVANTSVDQINFSIDETNSEFHQLSEVCENAAIFALADATAATYRRSQLIDQIAINNDLKPTMFRLTEDQQLRVGNEMSQLLLSRLKSWDRVEGLLNSDLTLSDLSDQDQVIELKEQVKAILHPSRITLTNKQAVLKSEYE